MAIFGTNDNDTINGLDGSDDITGGTGADFVSGGNGNDIIRIDLASEQEPGDTLSGGADYDKLILFNFFSAFSLADLTYFGIEELISSGPLGLTVTAAELNAFQSIFGTFRLSGSGPIVLSSPATQNATFVLGQDITSSSYNSGAGFEVLVFAGDAGVSIAGSASTDTINGGAGNDMLDGGSGDDVYMVDSLSDTVVENANEGTDTVRTAISSYAGKFDLTTIHYLAANVENLEMTGGAGQVVAVGIPVVYFNCTPEPGKSFASVTSTNALGAAQVADHLQAQGYRKLALISGAERSTTTMERQEGFLARVRELGLPEPRTATGGFGLVSAPAARELLGEGERPDAIFCTNDMMALAAIEIARFEFGLQSGRDLGVAGFDNIEGASWLSFDLTTYSQAVAPLIDRVVDIITNPADFVDAHFVVEGELVVRSSTKRD